MRTSDQTMTIMNNRAQTLWSDRGGADLIAKQTGGFLISNSNDFGIERVMEDQRGYYLLGYRPSDQTFNRRFHHIKLQLKARGMTVRTREGFYGVSEDDARQAELTTGDRMNTALMSPFGASDITVHLSACFVNEVQNGNLLRAFLSIDPAGLTFTEEADGSRFASFDLSGILFGDNGRVIGRKDLKGTLKLRGPSYENAVRNGFGYSLDIPVKQAGPIQFRVAIRDSSSSHIGAAGQFIAVPDLKNGRLALSGIVTRNAKTAVSNNLSGSQEGAVASGPAMRRFSQGSTVAFGYAIYNAMIEKSTHLPNLSVQTRVFREGKSVFSSKATPLDLQGQNDLQRITGASVLQLGPELSPGDYVFQVMITDQLAPENRRMASQSIDFEVIK
jgi:hypothetical protein